MIIAGRRIEVLKQAVAATKTPEPLIPKAVDVTNWIGDDGRLVKLYSQIRRHNPEGDLLFIRGEVTKKFEENGTKLVEISLTSENQDGERSAYGHAVAALPSRT